MHSASVHIVAVLLGFLLAGPVMSQTEPSAAATQQVSTLPGAEHSIVYRKEGVYACFPSLTMLEDGRLITEFGTRVRASHIDYTGGEARLISSDGGRSWQPTDQPIVDPKWKTKAGTLVTAMAEGWLNAPAEQKQKLIDEGRVVKAVRDGVVGYLGGAYYQVSTDGGKTWQKHPIDVPDYVSGLMNLGQPQSEVVTAKGVRLTAVYGPRKGKTKLEDHEAFILRSGDDGNTWKCIPLTPDGPPDPTVGYNETSLIELPNGDILAMLRIDPTGSRHMYRSISKDAGLTWSTPEKTEIWGYPCDLLVLQDGRLLCVYGYRKEPMGIRAALSNDNGKTWDMNNELVLRTDGLGKSPGDLGYPVVTQLPDGTLFTIYYFTVDRITTHIAGTHFRVPAKP